MNKTMQERIERAVAKADDAFWGVIASEFLECKSGDMAPLDVLEWDTQCIKSVTTWVRNNMPAKTPDMDDMELLPNRLEGETIEEYNSRLGELNSLCPLCEEREATEEGPYGVELCFDCLNKIRR